MDIQELDEVLVNLGLGHIMPELGRVTGGLLHRMWRVSATSGDYAVKQLNEIILERPRARSDYINSEKISRFMASKCIPAIPAIALAGNPLHLCGNDSIMIFKWFEGYPKLSGFVEPEFCEQIGIVLGSIHSNQPETINLDPPAFAFFDERHWSKLLDRARDSRVDWLNDAESAIDMVIEISHEYSKVVGDLRRERVTSHRDMDQKNVLWNSAGEMAVIDWESAGIQNPALDLLDAALNWSGMAKDERGARNQSVMPGQ